MKKTIKETVDQGSHTDEKKSVKPVEAESTKALKEGDKITENLQQQAERDAARESAEKAEANKNRVVDSTRVMGHTKKSYTELIELYKKSNPVKYEMKKAVLSAKLANL